jgi:hypothetical protein
VPSIDERFECSFEPRPCLTRYGTSETADTLSVIAGDNTPAAQGLVLPPASGYVLISNKTPPTVVLLDDDSERPQRLITELTRLGETPIAVTAWDEVLPVGSLGTSPGSPDQHGQP